MRWRGNPAFHQLAHSNPAAMSVVGIDFGNYKAVIAVARNRGIDIITNQVSNRFTPYVGSQIASARRPSSGLPPP